MKRRITRFGVFQTAKVFALMYFLLFAILLVPFVIIMTIVDMSEGIFSEIGIGIAVMLLIPFFYAVLIFIFVALGCLMYNLAAKWTGGIEVEIGREEVIDDLEVLDSTL